MQPDEKIQEKLPAAHAALAACMNPLVMADLDGHVTYANAACVRFWGCSDVSEILGRDLPDFFDGPEGAAAMGELRQRGSWAGELKARRKDGSCFDVYWSGNLAVSPETGVPLCVVASCLDVTEHKRADQERAATAAILRLTNSSNDLHEVMQQLTAFLGDWSSCDAVGIRLQQGDDFPYFETRGFPEAFVVAESRLCTTDREGLTVRDAQGNPVLECMCGNILCGRFDPTKPFFTEGGSFWSNCTSRLLASTTEADRQARTRNRCNGEGYESVALVPLRFDGKTFGLLQFNDKREGRFSADSGEDRRPGGRRARAAPISRGLASERDPVPPGHGSGG